MRLTALLSVFALSVPFTHAYATDPEYSIQDNASYCTEQASLSGIDDTQERSNYIRECIESMNESSTDELNPDDIQTQIMD